MADALSEEEVATVVAKAVADAIAPLQATVTARESTIAELEAKLGDRDMSDATAQAVADAVAPLNAKISDLSGELDVAKLAQGKAENEAKALTDWFQDLADTATVEQRRMDRIAAVKETGVWPEDVFDESVPANKDRIDGWAALDDVVFDALIDGWTAAGPRKEADKGNGDLPGKRSSMTDATTDAVTDPKGGRSGTRGVFERSLSLAPSGTDS